MGEVGPFLSRIDQRLSGIEQRMMLLEWHITILKIMIGGNVMLTLVVLGWLLFR